MFRDKVYEELDDISKLIEPYIDTTNDLVSMLNDEIVATPEDLLDFMRESRGHRLHISVSELIRHVADKDQLRVFSQSYSKEEADRILTSLSLSEFFSLKELSFNWDLVDESHRGAFTVTIKKTKCALDDAEIVRKFNNSFRSSLRNVLNTKDCKKRYMNDIADIFDISGVRESNRIYVKRERFLTKMGELIESKKIDIRTSEMQDALIDWIVAYVTRGSLPALKNITRFKIMMRQGTPIYSMEGAEPV